MGERGPIAKPKIGTGLYFRPSRPRMPSADLDAYGKKVWRRLIPLLEEAGILTLLDKAKLTRYCQLRGLYHDAMQFLQASGIVHLEPRKGYEIVKPWPQMKIVLDLHQALSRLESEFGMDPSSRSRIIVPVGQQKNIPFGIGSMLRVG